MAATAGSMAPRLQKADGALPLRTTQRRQRLHDLSIRSKLSAIVIAFTVAIIGLLAVIYVSFNLAAGVRGYTRGEGLWSKGEKDGVYWLVRYLRTQDEQDYRLYLESIRMPLGDREARLELGKPDFDPAAVERGFLAGGNSADDIPYMVSLFRHFGDTAAFGPAITVWSEADRYLLRLQDCAGEVHAAISTGQLTHERQDQLLGRLDGINANLTRL